ncbi:hypothetical protein Dimus_021346 [Dionaea muscipula]
MEVSVEAVRYWCHMCSQVVNPITESDGELKCPLCRNGFVEEMTSTGSFPSSGAAAGGSLLAVPDFMSDRALSLWAPILLGMMGNPRRRRRYSPEEHNDGEIHVDDGDGGGGEDRERVPRQLGVDDAGIPELDRELDSIAMRRRRRIRSSAVILQLLQGIRAGMATAAAAAADHPPANSGSSDVIIDGERERDRDRLILINPFNQTIIVQGSYDHHHQNHHHHLAALSDYIIGPGIDLLLQHLAENDPNRYGTPPAPKQVVEALPVVKIESSSSSSSSSSSLQCSVCLDDFEQGAEAKEMPCKHKFHVGCIVPWLEMHSSCPVCRYQLPAADEEASASSSASSSSSSTGMEESHQRSASERRCTLPWPLSTFFSAGVGVGVGVGVGIPSLTQSSSSESSTTGAPGTASQTQTDEERID